MNNIVHILSYCLERTIDSSKHFNEQKDLQTYWLGKENYLKTIIRSEGVFPAHINISLRKLNTSQLLTACMKQETLFAKFTKAK